MGDSSQGSKKNLADLSREELLDKCKNLLQLAQKAKAAKDGKITIGMLEWGTMCSYPVNIYTYRSFKGVSATQEGC
jgi:hypothetical protein